MLVRISNTLINPDRVIMVEEFYTDEDDRRVVIRMVDGHDVRLPPTFKLSLVGKLLNGQPVAAGNKA